MQEQEIASLPPFFPLVRSGCEEISTQFFQCLSEKSEPQGSSIAGERGLIDCKTQGDLYRKCMKASLDAKSAKKPIVLTEWETD
jgi:hypothetical protein